MRGLVAEGALVEEVAEDAEREDGGGEGIAGGLGITAKGPRQEARMVFYVDWSWSGRGKLGTNVVLDAGCADLDGRQCCCGTVSH